MACRYLALPSPQQLACVTFWMRSTLRAVREAGTAAALLAAMLVIIQLSPFPA